jgi:hypothetical protein
MNALSWYYVSRAIIAAIVATVAWAFTHLVGLAVAVGLLTFAAFVWYARSGHFMTDPGQPLTPLRRDERGQALTYQAATYAFVALMLLLAVLGVAGQISEPWYAILITVGFATYFIARAWLRRRA